MTDREYVEPDPEAMLDWLRTDINAINFVREERTKAFQMLGMYDGAMSEECKALFRQKYELLNAWVERK